MNQNKIDLCLVAFMLTLPAISLAEGRAHEALGPGAATRVIGGRPMPDAWPGGHAIVRIEIKYRRPTPAPKSASVPGPLDKKTGEDELIATHCSGVVVDGCVILSGHCFDDKDGKRIMDKQLSVEAIFGSDATTSKLRIPIRGFERVLGHDAHNDIAVFALAKSPARGASLPREVLANELPKSGTKLHLVGFGPNRLEYPEDRIKPGETSVKLEKGDLPMPVDNRIYSGAGKRRYGTVIAEVPRNLNPWISIFGAEPAPGDSGGPLLGYEVRPVRPILYGLNHGLRVHPSNTGLATPISPNRAWLLEQLDALSCRASRLSQ